GEVGYADMACQAAPPRVAERAHALRQGNGGIGPMQKKEVEAVDPEPLQTLLDRPLQRSVGYTLRLDLRGDEDVLARHAGGANSVADRSLIGIALRRIDVAEPEAQCLRHDPGADLPA